MGYEHLFLRLAEILWQEYEASQQRKADALLSPRPMSKAEEEAYERYVASKRAERRSEGKDADGDFPSLWDLPKLSQVKDADADSLPSLGAWSKRPQFPFMAASKGNEADRYVQRNTGRGGWDVFKEGALRASIHTNTKAEAIKRGSQIVRNQGGGELTIKDGQGRIVDSKMIMPFIT